MLLRHTKLGHSTPASSLHHHRNWGYEGLSVLFCPKLNSWTPRSLLGTLKTGHVWFEHLVTSKTQKKSNFYTIRTLQSYTLSMTGMPWATIGPFDRIGDIFRLRRTIEMLITIRDRLAVTAAIPKTRDRIIVIKFFPCCPSCAVIIIIGCLIGEYQWTSVFSSVVFRTQICPEVDPFD